MFRTKYNRLRVSISTPALNSIGDRTDRQFAGECDVDSILRKYGTINYNNFTSNDFKDVTNIPKDVFEVKLISQNVETAYRKSGSDLSIDDWIQSLFNEFEPQESEPQESKPQESKPQESKPQESESQESKPQES